jgi:FkbM family methyltransferase
MLLVIVFFATWGCSDTTNTAPSATSARDDILTQGEKLYSQGNEELIIRHFFQDRRGGVFLDVGAFHWKNHSTTLYLEHHLGWSGVAIDAQEKYKKGYTQHRPATQFFSFFVSDHSDDVTEFYISGAVSSASEEHIRKFGKEGELKSVEVVTITLDRLLDQLGIEQIDFLSMDIEGSEPPALRGFDIERFKPKLVCIEAIGPGGEAFGPYFEEHGYERIDEYLEYDMVNWYYRPRS